MRDSFNSFKGVFVLEFNVVGLSSENKQLVFCYKANFFSDFDK